MALRAGCAFLMGFNDCYHDKDTFPHRENNEPSSCAAVAPQGPSAWVNSIKSPKTNLRFAEVSRGYLRPPPRAGSPLSANRSSSFVWGGIRRVCSVAGSAVQQGLLWRPRILCLWFSVCLQSVDGLQLALGFDFLCAFFLLICSLLFSVIRRGVSYLARWAGDGRLKLISKGCVHEVRDSIMGYLNAKAFWKTVIKITKIVAQTVEWRRWMACTNSLILSVICQVPQLPLEETKACK